ncbi:hypothetical protein JI435_155480 [Parastagonospora nodorum SN15]|uniref:Uncharacterized protein n=1 Tax=Phaeosphaeria nodorum (strain SN15 / ATCC MYA-4574 / FGSC 10173) TaxID=321614 RepID=A0A7U2EY13_PHANO|nr:hypothetical protein HBI13_207280 [Parastagonospora nodorum]QRC93963.1 hypothetical protein JI435_155480 [Parastagonospora nodorum SN15]KAH4126619.1 hypothetical protein HBH45_220830 [Parastagonospora nodorum]KAH4148586.1 hypothetical protein HBH44_205340 [Parastagonospora nodorum]KAH4156338.1 hypothetical protein HBH43_206540 [Parastagonospora nodorum]
MEKHIMDKVAMASIAGFVKPSPATAHLRGIRSMSELRHQKSRQKAQDIEAQRTAYLVSRGLILQNYNEQHIFTPARIEDILNPLLSANGDIRHDFAILGRIDNDEQAIGLRHILIDVYGVDTLISRVENIITTAPPKDKASPWAKIARSARHLKQSFSQLKAESSRSAREAREPVADVPLNILESNDMLVILNARATVLLNFSFRGRHHSTHVVTLSSLARCLFSARRTDSDLVGRDASEEEKLWMIHRMLQLIRDDVYQILVHASQDFVEAEQEEQRQHLSTFCASLKTWQNMINRQIQSARGHFHQIESNDGFSDRMATLRAKCER